ncbi:ATP synthase F1 subcomplex epsilon subunit [Faunimonas pinastri]|uniref:ATP synthase epsilon chain n=1 Tax=Faunimonas pinastri TaxID=1855383 RepID=A0A1H9CV57_9HYPH|nr:F0F1 ATP synthase subunit epsilon [Faunimonas pinastri]SEQ04977.1 ATP synthase F1 subcomplex epsilon subunit [Faunimonas pinastri]
MADGLKFDLVSPERLLFSEIVESVVVPGTEGYLTVLANHAPLMTTLRPGVIEIKAQSGTVTRFFVGGGLVDINASGLTILADEAMGAEQMTSDYLSERIRVSREDADNTGIDYITRTTARQRVSDLEDVQRWILPA